MQSTPRIWERLLFIALVSLPTLSTDLYVPALPVLLTVFHTTPAALQQSLVSYLYGFAACMLLSGLLADRYPYKTILLIGLTLYTSTCLLTVLATTPWQLNILRFLQGLGGCCGTVIIRVMVRERFSPPIAIGILAQLAAGMAITFIVAPLLGTTLLQFFSWHACFLGLALLGIVLWIAVFICLKPARIQHHVISRGFYQHYWQALRHPDFIQHTLIIAVSWSGLSLILMEYPFLWTKILQYTSGKIGPLLALMMLGYFTGSILAKLLIRCNITSIPSIRIGLTIMLIATSIGLSTSWALNSRLSATILSLTAALTYLIGMGIVMPNSQYAAMADQKNITATAISLLYFIEMLSTACITASVKTFFPVNFAAVWVPILFMLGLLLIAHTKTLAKYIKYNIFFTKKNNLFHHDAKK